LPQAVEELATAPLDEEDRNLSPMALGSLVHIFLAELDFARYNSPTTENLNLLAATHGLPELSELDFQDSKTLIDSFTQTELFQRIVKARRIHREVQFAFALEAGG